ncbi:MAG TPA: hypothetical protein VK454_05365 [Myxococcaceae bacterium]|nr:hypothetical protein [Myxococcaceae bacterium]
MCRAALLCSVLALAAAGCGDRTYACVGICDSGPNAFDGPIGASSQQDAEAMCISRMGCDPVLAGTCTCVQE